MEGLHPARPPTRLPWLTSKGGGWQRHDMSRRRPCSSLVMAAALAGCGGGEAAPSEQVPVLGKQLEKVDDAVEARAAVKVPRLACG